MRGPEPALDAGKLTAPTVMIMRMAAPARASAPANLDMLSSPGGGSHRRIGGRLFDQSNGVRYHDLEPRLGVPA
jgi:hypothetical protein